MIDAKMAWTLLFASYAIEDIICAYEHRLWRIYHIAFAAAAQPAISKPLLSVAVINSKIFGYMICAYVFLFDLDGRIFPGANERICSAITAVARRAIAARKHTDTDFSAGDGFIDLHVGCGGADVLVITLAAAGRDHIFHPPRNFLRRANLMTHGCS